MQTRKGEEGFDRVDGHCGRGGAAMVIQETDDGELLALRQGSRTMPLIYTHLIPATLDGRARMNVANALAAAAAAWATGAHLHDIRQGLRTFSTSFFQAPGRLNEVDVRGFKVVIDYCHNVDGMRRLTEFVDLTMTGVGPHGRRRGPAGHGNGPRERHGRGRSASSASRATGATRTSASTAPSRRPSFDEIIVREDVNLRGRKPGESAAQRAGGHPPGARRRGALRRARGGDPRGARGGRGGHAPGAAGRPRGHLRRRLGPGLPRGHGLRPRCRASPSRHPASCVVPEG